MAEGSDAGKTTPVARLVAEVQSKEWYTKSSGGLSLANNKIDKIIDDVQDKVNVGMDRLYRTLLQTPKMTVLLMLIMATWFGYIGSGFQDQIVDDVEIFLPEGADSTDLLLEVRDEWTVDVSIIYIQTNNAQLGNGEGNDITDKNILEEISWIEGDDDNFGNGIYDRGIDWDKDDHGENDGILWVISIAQVIKEVNSSDGRFNSALCEHGLESRIGLQLDCEERNEQVGMRGDYTIPDQQRIDEIISRMNGTLQSLVKDTNDDGVMDTTAIIIGMRYDMSMTDQNFDDFDEFHEYVLKVIEPSNRPLDMRNTDMKLTGLTKVLDDVSKEIYFDLLNMMPLSLFFVVLVITALHRSVKIVIITGLPICMALAVTFGSSVLLKMTLTPMIVATGPILVGLGVDYSLHMINRIEESRNGILDRINETNYERRMKGLEEEKVPDIWDPVLYRQAILDMTRTTGVAVFLSAVTTIVGFSVLIAPQIVSVIPIRSVGLTLCIGIFSTLVFSILLVPTLGWILRFHKRANPPIWGAVGKWPVKNFVLILLVTGLVTGYGAYIMDAEMNKPITGSSDAPDNIESLETLATYSEQFGSGQTSFFVFDANQRRLPAEANGTYAIRDMPVLDETSRIENIISQTEFTNTTSVITFLDSIPITLKLTDGVELYDGTLWELLHEECWTSNDVAECGAWMLMDATSTDGKGREEIRRDLVDVSIDTLSPEVQSMLMNEAKSKSLVFVTQPYMNLDYAGGLRDDIDKILLTDNLLEDTSTSKLTGGLPVSLDINKGIHDTQSYTTILTLIILTLLLMIVFRNPRIGLLTMIPVAVVIIWQPLLMRSGDVNVNIFTAMIGTIVFGIGVDDAIHVMHRIREEGENAHGISKAIEHTGQTIFETTITTVAGLGAGIFVSFPGLVNFFMVMMSLIVFALITSVFLLPSTLTGYHRFTHLLMGKKGWGDLDGDPLVDEITVMPAECIT